MGETTSAMGHKYHPEHFVCATCQHRFANNSKFEIFHTHRHTCQKCHGVQRIDCRQNHFGDEHQSVTNVYSCLMCKYKIRHALKCWAPQKRSACLFFRHAFAHVTLQLYEDNTRTYLCVNLQYSRAYAALNLHLYCVSVVSYFFLYFPLDFNEHRHSAII